jgi:hypothetical protein
MVRYFINAIHGQAITVADNIGSHGVGSDQHHDNSNFEANSISSSSMANPSQSPMAKPSQSAL